MSSSTGTGLVAQCSRRNELTVKLLPTVAQAVKLSQELPVSNTPAYTYYNDFPKYKAVVNGQSRKILSIVQKMLDLSNAEANVLDVRVTKDLREKFSSLVDANDRILEKMAIAMDFEENPERKALLPNVNPDDLIVATHRKNATSLEWLKNVRSESSTEDPSQHESAPENILRLLSSRQITRPQASFTNAVDNTHSPFRPVLNTKPNAIVPLENSLPLDSESEEYSHPYEAELDQFAKIIPQWNISGVTHLQFQSMDTPFHLIDSKKSLEDMMNSLSSYVEIAVDLEHHNYRTFLGLTCLIQISTKDADYIIDALTLRDDLSCLNEIFTNPRCIKIFHGCDSDLMWLQRDFGVYVVNLFDTGIAARILQFPRFSLSYLLQRYVSVQTNKQYQLADWRLRPLPNELISYARTDTHYLLYIASRMCQELRDRGHLEVVLERGRQLCLKVYKKPTFNRLGYLDLYKQTGGISFTHRQTYALENLYALRDSIARREDESIHYTLPNHMLKVIAEILPRESSGLFACCNPIPPLVRKYVHDMHKIVLDARNRPISELPLTTPTSSNSDLNNCTQPLSATESTNNLISASPHDFSSPVALSQVNKSIHQSVSLANPSNFACSLSMNTDFGNKTVDAKPPNTSSEKLSIASYYTDPNRMLLVKMLSLLKLPCSPLLSVTENPSQQNDAQDSTPAKMDSSVISLNDSCLSNSSPHSSSPFTRESVILLCHQKTRSKKRRKGDESKSEIATSKRLSTTTAGADSYSMDCSNNSL